MAFLPCDAALANQKLKFTWHHFWVVSPDVKVIKDISTCTDSQTLQERILSPNLMLVTLECV